MSDLVEIGRQNLPKLNIQYLIFFLSQYINIFIWNTILEYFYKYDQKNISLGFSLTQPLYLRSARATLYFSSTREYEWAEQEDWGEEGFGVLSFV